MRTLLVVVPHPPGDPLPRRFKGVELRPAQELLPDRLPEPLDLPQRLRVMRGAAEVMHPVLLQFLLELRLPPPVRVLPPVVRQHLPGHPVLARPAPVYFQHVLRRLRTVETQAHDVPGMVINEPDQVGHLFPHVKRKNVALPHLVRGAALKKARLRGVTGGLLLHRGHQLPRVQRPPHGCGAGRQEQRPPQPLGDPLHPEGGVRLLDLHNLFMDRRRPVPVPPTQGPVPGTQPRLPAIPVRLDPVEQRTLGNARLLPQLLPGNPFLQKQLHGLAPLLIRPRMHVTNRSARTPLGGFILLPASRLPYRIACVVPSRPALLLLFHR